MVALRFPEDKLVLMRGGIRPENSKSRNAFDGVASRSFRDDASQVAGTTRVGERVR
jgi:hypothetical protein